MKHTVDDTVNIDWTNLAAVIRYAESLGPGYAVFRFSDGGDHYGITESDNIPKNCMFTGKYIGVIGLGIFVRAQKVFVQYRTKRRVIWS